jgi:hypothetical protein
MNKLDLSDITDKLRIIGVKISPYKIIIFLVLIFGLYGFLVYRINTLDNLQPSSDQVSAQDDPIRATHIDPSVVTQLQSLQDHSVTVQSLFDQARNNPFSD